MFIILGDASSISLNCKLKVKLNWEFCKKNSNLQNISIHGPSSGASIVLTSQDPSNFVLFFNHFWIAITLEVEKKYDLKFTLLRQYYIFWGTRLTKSVAVLRQQVIKTKLNIVY